MKEKSKNKGVFIQGYVYDVRGFAKDGTERLDCHFRLDRPAEFAALVGEWMMASVLTDLGIDESLKRLQHVHEWKVTVDDG